MRKQAMQDFTVHQITARHSLRDPRKYCFHLNNKNYCYNIKKTENQLKGIEVNKNRGNVVLNPLFLKWLTVIWWYMEFKGQVNSMDFSI